MIRTPPRPQQIVTFQKIASGAVEAHLPFFHKVGVVDDAQCNGHGLLDQNNRHALRIDLAHHIQELVDDERGQPKGELVDQQQSRLEDEGLAQTEHLLLAPRESQCVLIAPLSEARERLECRVNRRLKATLIPPQAVPESIEVLCHGHGPEYRPAAGYLGDPHPDAALGV
jgi:hypothetical protein